MKDEFISFLDSQADSDYLKVNSLLIDVLMNTSNESFKTVLFLAIIESARTDLRMESTYLEDQLTKFLSRERK